MSEYGGQSLWRDTAGADAATVRDLVERLEQRGRADDEIEARQAYLDLLGVSAGERVLDVGCGSGVVTRELARRVGPDGRVIGLDPSPALLTVARDLARDAGLADGVEFREGSVLKLPFPDGSFDTVTCVTVLSHVPGGEGAVPELARVLRPGGRAGVFDFDSDMAIYTHPDRALTRRIVAAASDAMAVDGWLARRLPILFAQAGLENIKTRGFVPIDTEPRGFYAALAERSADVAVKTGAITDEERRRWVAALHAEQARGLIVAGRLHIFTWGRKPAHPMRG